MENEFHVRCPNSANMEGGLNGRLEQSLNVYCNRAYIFPKKLYLLLSELSNLKIVKSKNLCDISKESFCLQEQFIIKTELTYTWI